MSEMTGKCVTCRFADIVGNDQAICRVNPPMTAGVMTPNGAGGITLWPTVKLATDWCGKHEEQLVKTAKKMPPIAVVNPGKVN